MTKIGMPGLQWQSYWTNLAAHAGVAFAGYALFGGLRLFTPSSAHSVGDPCESDPLDRNNWITLLTIFSLLTTVIVFKVNVGMGAFLAATFLGVVRAADHGDAVRKIPWNVIIMVSGVTVLIALLEKTQGLALFTDLLARIATKQSVTAVVAFLTGLVSVYSSTSGVSCRRSSPLSRGSPPNLEGADAVSIAFAMNVGSHLVDVSPLSTIGALCIAAAPLNVDTRRLIQPYAGLGIVDDRRRRRGVLGVLPHMIQLHEAL